MLLPIIILNLLSWTSGAVPTLRDEAADYLLPTGIVPSHYNLKLTTKIDKFNESDVTSFTFDGTAEVIFRATRANINTIVLHGKRIVIVGSTLKKLSNGSQLSLRNTKPIPDQFDKLYYQLTSGSLDVNQDYVLKIVYNGSNDDDLYGFYRSSYIDSNGKTRWLLTTQFASVFARRAFPSFDEPKLKATFNVSISLSKSLTNYIALTNTPQDGPVITDPDNSKNNLYRFKKTPYPVSTYIVAFVISDFHGTKAVNFTSDYGTQTGPKPYRTWGQADLIDNDYGNISQTIGPELLQHLTRKLKIGYGYQKMDQTGIPDFALGAMENWGLTTYRERYLLVNNKTDPFSAIRRSCTITVHELSHQWFGDLVTFHWWSDIWLNEGFATYFEYFAAAELQNNSLNIASWDLRDLFLVNELQASAFVTDSIENVRPMTDEVYVPDEIEANFDNIAYPKGGSVLRMFSHIVGEDTFFVGLQIYLQARQLNNTTPQDLTKALQQAADKAVPKPNLGGKTVDQLFDNWRLLPGYPVVNVTRINKTTLKLSQKRFYRAGGSSNSKWFVPITYYTNRKLNYSTSTQQWLTTTADLSITIDSAVEWVVINNQQTGYYRVNYDLNNWKNITKTLNNVATFKNIHVFNRAQLIDDSFSLATSTSEDYLPYSVPLQLTAYIDHETETAPLLAASNHVGYLLSKVASYPEISQKLKMYAVKLFKTRYDKLTFNSLPNEKASDRFQREKIVSLACSLGIPDCVYKATMLFDLEFSKFKHEGLKMNPDIRRAVYCTAVKHGPSDNWNKLWNRYIQPKETVEKDDIIAALGCSRDITTLRQFLDKTLDNRSRLQRQDRLATFLAVIEGNPENIGLASAFLTNHFMEIVKMYGSRATIKLLGKISKVLNKPEDLINMQNIAFMVKTRGNKEHGGLIKAIESSLNFIKGNIQWNEKKMPELNFWLNRGLNN